MPGNIEVSYIIGHKNRTELLEYNLESLLHQTNDKFEIVITDNSNEQYKEKLKEMCLKYRKLGLDIKVFFIDPKLCKFSHDGTQFDNGYNPAVQQNIAVKKSRGRIVTLTSPEVVNCSTNVDKIVKYFSGIEKKFVLGWIQELKSEDMPQIIEQKYEIEHMKIYSEKRIRNPRVQCKPGQWRPWNYFLGSILRKDYIDIGGIDEEFMAGIAYEDNEFVKRCANNGIEILLNVEIAGLHLQHPTKYHTMGKNINPTLMHAKQNNKIANINHDWGSDNCIIGTF